jgi:hyperosmotically inducible protein
MKFRSNAAACVALALSVACSETDSGVTASVKSRLAADSTMKARNINVETKDHIVTLSGQVDSTQEQARALELARKTGGVVDVVDNLTVASAESNTAPTSGRVGDRSADRSGRVVLDPGISGDVRSRLLADSALKNLKIDVETRDRVVTLTGTVDTQTQKDHAIEVARSVDNVAHVEDRMTVRNPSR